MPVLEGVVVASSLLAYTSCEKINSIGTLQIHSLQSKDENSTGNEGYSNGILHNSKDVQPKLMLGCSVCK